MNLDDIIRMAREAGMSKVVREHSDGTMTIELPHPEKLERFAALVAAEKQQKMIRDGWRKCAEGQRATQHCALLEAAVLAERERCAEIARQMDQNGPSNYGAVIAARIYEISKDRSHNTIV